jgi:hypothetical protein
MMFKHLKELGLEKHDTDGPSGNLYVAPNPELFIAKGEALRGETSAGSVEGSPPSTDEGRRAGPALQDQHRQGGPAKSKPIVAWADLSDGEQLRGVNQGSWRGEQPPKSLACETVLLRKVPKPRVLKGPARWADGEAAHMGALKDQTQEDAIEVIRAKHDSKVDVGEGYSPPSVVKEAVAMVSREGFSLDLTA